MNTEHTKVYLERVLYIYRSMREGGITWRRMHDYFRGNYELVRFNDEEYGGDTHVS